MNLYKIFCYVLQKDENQGNKRLSVYTRNENEKGDKSAYKYEYTYSGEYLSNVKGNEDGDLSEETFSFVQSKFIAYNYLVED